MSQESFYSQMTNSVEEIKLCFRAQTGLISSEVRDIVGTFEYEF